MSELTSLSVAEAHNIVTQIAKKKGWVPPELRERSDPETLQLLEIIRSIREELGHAVETIARDIYSRKARFILELIQNAEDNQFTRTESPPSITFEVHPEKIVVECNEDGFTETNVQSICRIGRSSKKSNRGYIGEKGIGFKSVFQVASKIRIQSNSFSFYFQYDGGPSSEEKLGIVTPIPEDIPIPWAERPLTRMTLTPLRSIPYEDFLDQFQSIPDTLLLFLSTLKELKIKIHHPNQRISVTTFHKSKDLAAGMIKLVKTFEYLDDPDGKIVNEARYYIVKKQIQQLPKDRARPDIDECEVILAFPLDGNLSPLISAQDIFAFLPIRSVGLSFVIQADFILQANRQDVVDSARNKAILEGVSETFRDAILNFCRRFPSLRYKWMRFLPSGRAPDDFWETLSSEIVKLLSNKPILYAHESQKLFEPQKLCTLPVSHLDRHGQPLFKDRAKKPTYLSRLYDPGDVDILSKAFDIKDIDDNAMYKRIKLDLGPSSSMKASDTDDDWHSRAADLMLSISRRSPSIGDKIRQLGLIPLADGNWVNTSADDLYFPSESGPELPLDLMVTVDPVAVRNDSRKRMLTKLGVTSCPSGIVIERLWRCYSRDTGASDETSSLAHLRYLYWNHENINDKRFLRLWLYDTSGKEVTSRRKVIYFESNDEYGPQELLKAVQHPKDPGTQIKQCPVPFMSPVYLSQPPAATPRHKLSWLDWLEKALGVRHVPRLKSDTGALSHEFRHIIIYRPEKVIGLLKKHWDIYELVMSDQILETLSQAEVACRDKPQVVLNGTYLPLPNLEEIVQRSGISQGFPFLKLPNIVAGERVIREWRFLIDFGVGSEADLKFYLKILLLHEAQNYRNRNREILGKILKTYESIADLCSNKDKAWIRKELDINFLILSPYVFRTDACDSSWIDVESCVWNGPEDLLDKEPLASAPEYRDNQKLACFFREVLEIKDATWEDYLDMLLQLRRGKTPLNDISTRVSRLYHLFSETKIGAQNWAEISESFEENELIYMPSISEWFAPSECVWTSPVRIDGKAIISDSYPEELKRFFLKRLSISPASLSTLVEELVSMIQRNPTVSAVKQMVWAINRMNPLQEDLDSLSISDVLPVRAPDGSISFQSCQEDFVVVDRDKIAELFEGVIAFLDFSLEEVRQLDPFIQATGLDKKYLSILCEEKTAYTEIGSIDDALTEEFKQRAYDLLRCAVSYRSPLSPRSLYERLLNASIFKTDSIITQYTICQTSGDKNVDKSQGYVHVIEQEDRWQILVPQNRRDRELCYLRHLPEALTKLFKVASSAREVIGNVLNSRIFILDDLLDAAGIGKVSSIQPPPRLSPENFEEQETIATAGAVSSLRNARARSAPLLSSRDRTSQSDLQNVSSLQSREPPSPSIGIGDGISRPNSTSPRASRVSTPNSETSDIRDTPSIIGFRDSIPRISQEAASFFGRSLSPGLVNRESPHAFDDYRALLDNIIHIADRSELPTHDFLPVGGSGQFHQGFDHEATFGIRSQGQMNHDIKIGAAGELYVFEILSGMLPASFGRHNWKSTIRKEVSIHPKYHDMVPWSGPETADIVYEDDESNLTTLLIQRGHLDESVWRGATPRYYIEVKTTTGEWKDRFFMSNSQYLRMQRLALTPGQTSAEVYIVCRVFNLSKSSLNMKIYVDPEAYRQRDELMYEAQSWAVTPRM